MKKFLKYLMIIFLVILVLVLIIPYFISLDRFKNTAEQKYFEATGQKLSLKGPLTFALLPTIQVSAKDAVILAPTDVVDSPLAQVGEANLKLSLLSLLQGDLEILSITIQDVTLNLKKNKEGGGNWDLSPHISSKTSGDNLTGSSTSSHSSKVPFKINNFTLKDGKVSYQDSEQALSFENINISLNITYDQKKDLFIKGVEFKVDSKMSEEDLKLQGQVKNLDTTKASLSATLKAYGESLDIEGILSLEEMSFSGKASLKGTLSKSPLFSKSFSFFKADPDIYSLETTIQANLQHLTFPDLIVQVGGLKGKGQGSFNFGNGAAFFEGVFNPGALALKIDNHKDSNGQLLNGLSLKSENLATFLKIFSIQIDDIPSVLLKNFSLKTLIKYQDQNLFFKGLHLSLGHASLQGELAFKNGQEKPVVVYDLSFFNLLFFKELKPIAPFLETLGDKIRIKGESSFQGSRYETRTLLSGNSLKAAMQGSVDLVKEIDIQVKTSGKSLSHFFESSEVPLGSYEAIFFVKGDMEKGFNLRIAPSQVYVGQKPVKFEGNITLGHLTGIPKVGGELVIDTLNLDAFSGPSQESHHAPQQSPSKHSAARGVTARGRSSQHTLHSEKIWSHKEIDLSFLNLAEGDIKISLSKIIKDAFIFEDVKAHFQLGKGELNLNPCTGKGLGGSFTVIASISSKEARPVLCKGSFKDIRLREFNFKKGDIKLVGGMINLDADLTSHGKSMASYVKNLNGTLNFAGNSGKISGFSLSKVVSALKRAKSLPGFLELLNSSFKEGVTEFDSFKVALLIQNGAASLKTCELDSDIARIMAKGIMDLFHYNINVLATIKLNISKNFPSFDVKLSGPLNAPQHSLETQALQNYLIENVFSGLVGSVIDLPLGAVKTVVDLPSEAGEIVGGLLGLDSNTNEKKKKSPKNKPSEDNSLGGAVKEGLSFLGL